MLNKKIIKMQSGGHYWMNGISNYVPQSPIFTRQNYLIDESQDQLQRSALNQLNLNNENDFEYLNNLNVDLSTGGLEIPNPSELFPKPPKISKFKNFMKQHGMEMANMGLDFANSLLPEKDEYEGKYGDISQDLDAGYNTASNVVTQINPVAGLVMKGGSALNKGMNALGAGTDGMTKTDAILGSDFLAPIGWINGFFGKRANSFSKDYDTFETIGSSYTGSDYLADEALSKSRKKYGLFSKHARHNANRQIAEAARQQNIMGDIADEATDRFSIRDSMSAINGNRRNYLLNGGYEQAYNRVGKNGMKLQLKQARDILNRSKKLQQGGSLNTPNSLDPFQFYFRSLPENQRDSSNYRVQRYWELNGKPKDFEEAKKLGMFTKESDGWHARTVAYNKDADEYEFMKSPNHPSIWMEEAWYNGFTPRLNPLPSVKNLNTQDRKDFELIPLQGDEAKDSENFRNDYELDKSGDYWKYVRRKKVESHKDGGSIIELFKDNLSEIELLDPEQITDIAEFKEGGEINIIPEGALHARKHNMETEGITKKGIPVVAEKEGGEIEQQAEIEREEIIFRLEVTKKLESLEKKYYSEETSQKEKDELALEAGKLLTEEILHNTQDNTNNLL